MATDGRDHDDTPAASGLPDDSVLLFNRALVVMHSVRTAVHELNNVFQMISGSVELLQNNPALPDTLRPRLDAILRQSNRGEGLVRGVGELARRESPGPRTLDMDEALERALEARRFEHRRSGIAVERRTTSGGPWTLRADPAEIQQLLLGLLIAVERALGESPEAKIVVDLVRRDSDIELTISRTGVRESQPASSSEGRRLESGLSEAAAAMIAAKGGGRLERAVSDVGEAMRLTLPGADAPPL